MYIYIYIYICTHSLVLVYVSGHLIDVAIPLTCSKPYLNINTTRWSRVNRACCHTPGEDYGQSPNWLSEGQYAAFPDIRDKDLYTTTTNQTNAYCILNIWCIRIHISGG